MNTNGQDPKHNDKAATQHNIQNPSPAVVKQQDVVKTQDLTSDALRFLSTASPETLCAVLVALAACTYLILGRLGLILIGVLCGVVSHATWEGQSSSTGKLIRDARRETGLDILSRILDLRHELSTPDDDPQQIIADYNFESFRPETASALNDLVESIIRDYVKWWYLPIIPSDESFPAALRQTLTKFLSSVSQHLSRKRPADTFLDLLTNSSSIIIVFLNELSSALNPSQSSNISAAEAVHNYLSANPESNLANVLNEKQQAKKFKMVSDDILRNFLEKTLYDCEPVRVFLRELTAGVVLEMTLKTCSKADWLNGWIVHLLEDGEPDISQVIDAGMSSSMNLRTPHSDIDGNVGNVGLVKSSKPHSSSEEKGHKKRLSKAEEAMEEAILEAKRLSELIVAEDKMRLKLKSSQERSDDHKIQSSIQGTATLTELDTKEINDPVVAQHPSADDRFQSHTYEHPLDGEDKLLSGSYQEIDAASASEPVKSQQQAPFTNFDQIIPQSIPVALQTGILQPLTLQNANITIHDDSSATDKGRIWAKPASDFLIQIEPEASQHPGWMIVRKYPDFETLHEVLRRIASISDARAFAEQHPALPNWKEHTKPSLRGELERYLREACWHKVLAESEGMKRFLEKDRGQSQSSSKNGFSGIGWPTPSAFENMGKGMLDVLTSAPKGAAEGSKVVLGGVTGVFQGIGTLGQKKQTSNANNGDSPSLPRSSTSVLSRSNSVTSFSGSRKGRLSEESQRASPTIHTQPSKIQPIERQQSYTSIVKDENELHPRLSSSARSSMSERRSANHSRDPSRAPSKKSTPLSSPTQENLGEMRLPSKPNDMPEEFSSPSEDFSNIYSRRGSSTPTTRTSISTTSGRPSLSAIRRTSTQMPRKAKKEASPLSEQETGVAVELLFAVISELYKLSSAWNIRRTLLTAAKTFLLRPGNPSLSSIQSLIQDSVIASNTSDTGIASHLRKVRENALPTDEELKNWPAELSLEEREKLRIRARKLLVERGVPAALTGVMGQTATGEAVGRVFDCLQVENVLRGLMFGLILQGVRAITQ